MKFKKITSLTVVLAMIMSLIMSFGTVTASADDAKTAYFGTGITVTKGNGSFEAVSGVDNYYVTAGGTVVIKAVPDEGWSFDPTSMEYQSADGTYQPLTLTAVEGQENQYSFTVADTFYNMWGMLDVFYVRGGFSPILEDGEYEIVMAKPSSSNASWSFIDRARYGAKEGETVQFQMTFKSATQYYVPTVTKTSDGTVLPLTIDYAKLESTTYGSEQNLSTVKASFTMPAESVTITASNVSTYTSAEVTTNPDTDEFKAAVGTLTSIGSALSVNNIINGKYYTHDVTVTALDNSTAADGTQTAKGTLSSVSNDVSKYNLNMYATSVKVNVDFTEIAAYSFIDNASTKDADGNADGNVTLEVQNRTMAPEGTEIEFEVTTNTAAGYYYDSEKLPVVTYGDNQSVDVTLSKAYTQYAKYTFTMPAGNVTISLPEGYYWQEPEVQVNVEDGSGVTLDRETGLYRYGETITLTKADDANYDYLKVTTDGKTRYYRNDTTSLSMPDTDNPVTVSTEYVGEKWTDEGNYDAELYASQATSLVVSDAADLAAIAKKVIDNKSALEGATVDIAADIDMSGKVWIPMSMSSEATINGNNHKISGLDISVYGTGDNGSDRGRMNYGFMSSGNRTEIHDLTLEGKITARLLGSNAATNIAAFSGYGTLYTYNCVTNVDMDISGIAPNRVIVAGAAWSGKAYNDELNGTITVHDAEAPYSFEISGVCSSSYNTASNINIVIGDNVTASTLNIYGIRSDANYSYNSYFGGTITGAPETAAVYGVAGTISADTVNYSYYTPACPEGADNSDNAKIVGENNRVGVIKLTTYLNDWVSDQTGDITYLEWKAGDDGKPVHKAASSDTASYAITSSVTGSDYGTTTVNSSAAAGSKVTVYVSPKNFCSLSEIKATQADGTEVGVTKASDTSYTFYMPGEAVTVSTTYVQAGYSISLTDTSSANGTVTIDGSESHSNEMAKSGETITVSVAPNKYYAADKVTVTDSDGENVEVTADTLEKSFTFTMPEKAVTIDVSYRDNSAYFDTETGALKAGKYIVKSEFGYEFTKATKSLSGILGCATSYSDMILTVGEDGSITVDDYDLPTVDNPFMKAGSSYVTIYPSALHVDGDSFKNAAKAGDCTIVPTVLKYGTVNSSTGEKTVYDGDVYTLDVMNGGEVCAKMYSTEDIKTIAVGSVSTYSKKMLPLNISFGGMDYLRFDDDYANQNINISVFITEMSDTSATYYTMISRLDFDTIKAYTEDTDDGNTFGSAKTELKAGEYDITVSMMKASNITSASMAAGCIKSAKLIVAEDGKATIKINLGPVTFAGVTLSASGWKLYPTYGTDGTAADMTYTTDADGAVDSITFDIPDNSWDGVYVNMFIGDPMNVAQDAYFALDYANAKASEPETTYEFGSAKTVLNPGEYNLPITMMKASDITSASMAGSCVKGATLTVNEDAAAKVTVDLGAVKVGSISDWAKDWKVYPTLGVDGTAADMAYTTDADGNVDSVTFDVTDNSWDGVYVNMFIGAMNTTQNAYFALDYANAAAKTEEQTYEFGSAKTELKAGEYSIPVSMKKASKITEDSMAKTCIKDAVLTVNEDGSAKVKINLDAVTVGAITDWAYNWKLYPTLGTDGEAALIAETTTNADGKIDSITFDIPDNSWDGVYVNMYVDAMATDQDAYLAFDYANARDVNDADVKTYTGTSHIDQFGEYDVDVTVTVTNGKISAIEITGKNFAGTHADFNQTKFNTAKEGLQDSYNGIDATDAQAIYDVDAVSSATYTSNAIRDAIMNALNLAIEEEVINLPTEKLAEGEYSVDIAFYSDIVKHSLVENEKIKAKITVDADGNMTLSTDVINGTEKEPLYVTEFNGVYTDNDTTKELSTEGVEVTKGTTTFSDDVFAEGTPVVTSVTMPLKDASNENNFAKIYNTNTSLYVPAMKNLTGEQGGIMFDRGQFSVTSFVKVYWDSLSKFSISAEKKESEEGTVSYDVTLKNGLTEQASGEAVVALYKDGRMMGVVSQPIDIPAEGETTVNAYFTNDDYDTLKVFLWDSTNTMTPIISGAPFSQAK